MDSQAKRLRIELLVAGPPTGKCKALIQMMSGFLTEFPDLLQIDIYYAGEAMVKIPTEGYKRDPANKNRRVPSAYINGKKIASQVVPERELVREFLIQELGKELTNRQ